MMKISHRLAWTVKTFTVFAVLMQPFLAQAQDESPDRKKDDKAIFTAALENDIVSGNDNNYTNGVRFSYLSAEDNVPDWIEEGANFLPFFSESGYKRWHLDVGQSMFTPENLDIRTLQYDDRPYAGWLYGSVGVTSDTGERLDNLQLTVGMVGESSRAEQTQRSVHELINGTDPQGWDNQLKDEVGVVLTYERKWRGLYEFSPFGWGFDITPSVGGSLGNVYTHGAVGAVARFGYDLPSDYGPPLIRPNLPGSDFFIPTQDIGWYLFGGLEGRAVARNIFLDGNTFKDSHSVDKYPLVGGAQAGVALTYGDTRLAYTQIFRTKEFTEQSENDVFGALTVSRRF
jgi:lipid A 3-O-deacylase